MSRKCRHISEAVQPSRQGARCVLVCRSPGSGQSAIPGRHAVDQPNPQIGRGCSHAVIPARARALSETTSRSPQAGLFS